MRTISLLPLALAGLLGGCAVYAPDPYYGQGYGYGATYSSGYPPGYSYGYGYQYGPRYYGPPPAVVIQPGPIIVPGRLPGGRRSFDRDRDGVPDRHDRRPGDPRRR